jgi:hypothetical protein
MIEGKLKKLIHEEAEQTGFELAGDMTEEFDRIATEVVDEAKTDYPMFWNGNFWEWKVNRGYVKPMGGKSI